MSQKYLIRIAELERLLSEQAEALRQKDRKRLVRTVLIFTESSDQRKRPICDVL